MGALTRHFRQFALYNRWANARLYEAAAGLGAAELEQDQQGFFGSLLGTLNHLLVADRIWLARLNGAGPSSYRLDEILCPEYSILRAAREAEDQNIVRFVFGLDEDNFSRVLNYATQSGAAYAQPLGEVLAHMFNHQTHHRGQAHDQLGRLAGTEKTPVLDLLAYQRGAAANDRP